MTITVYTISFKVGPKKKWNRKTHVNNQFYSDPFYRINWFSFTFWHDQIGVRYVNKGIVPITKAATSQMYIFPSRNFLNVHFPKRKLPKCTFFRASISRRLGFEALQAAMGPSAWEITFGKVHDQIHIILLKCHLYILQNFSYCTVRIKGFPINKGIIKTTFILECQIACDIRTFHNVVFLDSIFRLCQFWSFLLNWNLYN